MTNINITNKNFTVNLNNYAKSKDILNALIIFGVNQAHDHGNNDFISRILGKSVLKNRRKASKDGRDIASYLRENGFTIKEQEEEVKLSGKHTTFFVARLKKNQEKPLISFAEWLNKEKEEKVPKTEIDLFLGNAKTMMNRVEKLVTAEEKQQAIEVVMAIVMALGDATDSTGMMTDGIPQEGFQAVS